MIDPYQYPNELSHTFSFFQKGWPEPNEQNVSTQIGCHFEEVAEMMAEITPTDQETMSALFDAKVAIQHLADRLKKNAGCVVIEDENRKKFLDALCDQIVTATGSGHMVHMDVVGGMSEVNRSNFSKFDDKGQPIFHPETGKMIKGPNYFEADLTPYV